MAHLPALEEDARLLTPRPSEFQHRGRAAHALQLNDVGNVQVAQRPTKLFLVGFARRPQQRLDQIDKITMWERFFQKMNRTETSRLLALRGQLDGRENNGARIRMARA